MPRIIAGQWRGRVLASPPGSATRPTAERLRQALFDMLWHAEWGGREWLGAACVLDAFAGTGAMGLEALSRGAVSAVFMEQDRAALNALRANVAACGAEAAVLACDATRPPRAKAPCDLVFLDPPYGEGLIPRTLAALGAAGWIAPDAVVVAEHARDQDIWSAPHADAPPIGSAAAGAPDGWALLATRAHGAGAVTVLRAA
ncbi:16S rRNA (guanine(966)-N(2))-methyltransferase RsmD [Plastoroseomonas arctica]|uniref:16S rRNA (guanine(966)-N(2))-methyltransferase RsmD n=1 Tax=Plastoroseomonas arctica TaxID=1509237 RepID=UPI0038CF969F